MYPLKRIIKERIMRAGYVLRTEEFEIEPGRLHIWTKAYTPRGEFIGDATVARRLCVQRGIAPQLANPKHNVCSIGYSATHKKWYGWSHRAIYGFKIGSKCKKGNCHYIPVEEGGKGEWVARTMADAHQMAVDFAKSVG